MNSNNKKLALNIFLMFWVYFLPKSLGFLLLPVYTSYLSTEEYGIADVILTTSCLISPFVSLGMPGAIFRFNIENKDDYRPYCIATSIFVKNVLILILVLCAVYFLFQIKFLYLFYLFLTIGFSLLSDINISYLRSLEKMKLVSVCGVGSSFLTAFCNVLFIVVFNLGLYGFLLSSIVGYAFNYLVSGISIYGYRKKILSVNKLKGIKILRKEMLQFSIPTIFSGILWWVTSSSDRYFITWMCGSSANGIYSVAFKIPLIIVTIDAIFGAAWLNTLYDTYKTKEGKAYIIKVFNGYSFLLCFLCSFLIMTNKFLSNLLFSKEFYEAWKYVPILLISVVLSTSSNFLSTLLAVYKKTKISLNISIITALLNVSLNWILISITRSPLGAALATSLSFLVTYALNYKKSKIVSNIDFHTGKQLLMFIILCLQSALCITNDSPVTSSFISLVLIAVLNYKLLKYFFSKFKLKIKKFGG